jgi:hypothetical protein
MTDAGASTLAIIPKGVLVLLGVVAAAAASTVLTVLTRFDPRTTALFPRCPLYAATGLFCPGCGITRALHELLHGNISGAIACNPLLIVTPFGVAMMFKWRSWFYRPSSPWILLTTLFLYGVLRNVPVWPLSMLAPH